MNAVLIAVAKPLAVVLLSGLVKFLFDYQQSPHLVAAVLDGVLTAALTASSYLGVTGAISGVQNARAAAITKE